MNLFQITFSPTGGTEKVAKILSSVWEESAAKVNLLKAGTTDKAFGPDDVCIVAVPSFGGRVPQVAVDRLQTFKGNGARAILVAVYGNRHIDDTLLELQDVLEGAGFQCVAGIEAVAEHSLVREVAAGRPDLDDQAQLKEFAAKIKFKFDSGNDERIQMPGNRPFKQRNPSALKPFGGFNCNGCGFCALECPTGAIPRENPKFVESDACISCMRCVTICPRKARKVDENVIAVVSQKLREMCSERKANKLYI